MMGTLEVQEGELGFLQNIMDSRMIFRVDMVLLCRIMSI